MSNNRLPSVADQIEAQRQRMFEAMNLIWTTAMACSEEDLEDMSRRGTLEAAHKLLDDIALELNRIPGVAKVSRTNAAEKLLNDLEEKQ